MKPGMCYRVEPLSRFTGLRKEALRRYLRRLTNAGLLTLWIHPLYPKRNFYSITVKGHQTVLSSQITGEQLQEVKNA